MAKKEYTREDIAKAIEEFCKEKGSFSKTSMTIDFMDAYVAWFRPETIETWISNCLEIPMTTRKIGGEERQVKDIKQLRKLFIDTYFPEQSDDAKEAEKARKKAEREAEKARKEAEENMTDAEKLRLKMERLAEKKD